MLNGKFRRRAFMYHYESYVASFLRNLGFTNLDILALLCILKSFHQNTASYISCNRPGSCRIYSNSFVEFSLNTADHRNYKYFSNVLRVLHNNDVFKLSNKAQLWCTQMYALLRLCSCTVKFMLSRECLQDEEIVKKLVEDVEQVCACIMACERENSKSSNVIYSTLEYFQYFSNVLLGGGNLVLFEVVREARSQYSQAIQGLEEGMQEASILRIITLVIYKTAISRFIVNNNNVLSGVFKSQVFSMVAQFACSDINTLPLSCRSHLGINNASILLDFYKNLFYVFHLNNMSEYYETDDQAAAAIGNDLYSAVGGSLNIVSNPSDGYNPLSNACVTYFVNYDAMLAVNEVLQDESLRKALAFEHMVMLYKTLLTEKICDLNELLVSNLGDYNFVYVDQEENRYGIQLLYEIVSTCYHIAFVQRFPMAEVSGYYEKCRKELSAVALAIQSASKDDKVLLMQKLMQKYRENMKVLQGSCGCQPVACLEDRYSAELLCVLLQDLLLGKLNVAWDIRLKLPYDLFLQCRPVNEVKAQQAAMMLCQAFKKSDGVIDNSSVESVTGLLMILLFGDFLQRNILLRLFDVFHVAYRKSEEYGTIEGKNILGNFVGCCHTVLNLLKSVKSNLPFCFSMESLEDLKSDDISIYGGLMCMINCCASELSLSLSDLEQERDRIYSAMFSEVLGSMPVSQVKAFNSSMQIVPCNECNPVQCLLAIQLLSSYVCLYNSDKVVDDLFFGNLCSPGFLLAAIITYPVLSSSLAQLCYRCTLAEDYSVEQDLSGILKLLCSKRKVVSGIFCDVAVDDMAVKESIITTNDVARILVKADGSSNLDPEIVKNACFNIIELRELGSSDVEECIKSASSSSGPSNISQPELMAFLSLIYNTNLSSFSESRSFLSKFIKHDDNNNVPGDGAKPDFNVESGDLDNIETDTVDCAVGSGADVAQKSKSVIVPYDNNVQGGGVEPDLNVEGVDLGDNIETDTVDCVVGSEADVAQNVPCASLEPNINEVEKSKVHGKKLYFDSGFCDQTQLDKRKSQAKQLSKLQLQKKRRHCISAAAGMVSVFTILMCVAFACQMRENLFIGCVALGIICLTLSMIFCLSVIVDTCKLGRVDHKDIQPALNYNMTKVQEPKACILDSHKTTDKKEAIPK